VLKLPSLFCQNCGEMDSCLPNQWFNVPSDESVLHILTLCEVRELLPDGWVHIDRGEDGKA